MTGKELATEPKKQNDLEPPKVSALPLQFLKEGDNSAAGNT